MKIKFAYSREKDVWCLLNKGKSSNNSPVPTKTYEALVSAKGENPSPESISDFIEQYIQDNRINILELIKKFQDDWATVEDEYHKRAGAIFNVSLSDDITAYLTTNTRCPYNIEENYFFVSMLNSSVRKTIMHELFHFYTWYGLQQELKDVSKEKYNDIKESLTVLLNLEFSDLLDGAVDYGYPQHQEMRTIIKELWLSEKDLKKVVIEISK